MSKSYNPITPISAVSAAILLLTLTGCFGETERDVNYYLEHPEEREAKIEACRNDIRKHDANYENAKEALLRAMLNPKNTKMPKIK